VAAAGDTSTVGGRTTWRTTITGTFASFKHRCDTLPSNNLMLLPDQSMRSACACAVVRVHVCV
jgi:hypothetical protein